MRFQDVIDCGSCIKISSPDSKTKIVRLFTITEGKSIDYIIKYGQLKFKIIVFFFYEIETENALSNHQLMKVRR